MEIKIIINADDFGISDGVCKGILELFDLSAISNTTIMVGVPGAVKRLKKWQVNQLSGKVGIHLQLTSGRPISPVQDIPTLVDSRGYFLPKEKLIYADPKQVEIEWRRQIELGANLLQSKPSHIDSHKGVHRIPYISDVYLSLAKEFSIPVRGGGEDFERKCRLSEVPGSSYLIRDWTGHFLGEDILLGKIIQAQAIVGKQGIIEVVTHPGYCDSYLKQISTLCEARQHDLAVLKRLKKYKILALNEMILIQYPNFTPVVGG